MIFKGSRYSRSKVINPLNPDGENPRVLARRDIDNPKSVFEYTVNEGDRLDLLANRFYSEPQKYWLILDANPDILNPFELLQVGKIIKIPKNRIVK